MYVIVSIHNTLRCFITKISSHLVPSTALFDRDGLKTRIGTIHEDVTTDVLGKIGPWQWLVTMVSTALMTTSLFDHYQYMNLLTSSKFTVCMTSELIDNLDGFNHSLCIVTNSTGQYDCDKWHLKFMGLFWINRRWTIFCEDKMQLLAMAMICRLGAAFGCVTFGLIADSFGRKKAIQLGVFLELPVRLIITFCDSEGWFRLLIFLRSLFGGANVYMGLLLTCEIASNTWRSRLMSIAALPRIVASVSSVSLANVMPNEATFNFIACIYTIFLIFALRWAPESPQWSIFNRKIVYAEKVLFEAAKRNNIGLCSDFKIRPVNHRAYESLEEVTSCLGILTIRNVRILVSIVFTQWVLFSFLWGSLYFTVYSRNTPKNIYTTTFCCGILLGSLAVSLMQRVKLRLMFFVSVVATGVCTSGFLYTEDSNEFIRISISTVGVTSGLLGQCLILNITPRLFAIEIRATMTGTCHALGQISTMINYLLISMEALDKNVLTAMIMLFTVMLCVICFVIPDVDGRELPDLLEDMDYFLELTKPLRWATQKTHSPSIEEVQLRVYSFGSGGRESIDQRRRPASPMNWQNIWRRIRNLFRPTFFV